MKQKKHNAVLPSDTGSSSFDVLVKNAEDEPDFNNSGACSVTAPLIADIFESNQDRTSSSSRRK